MAVTSEGRVALYLQDKHPIREGMEYAQLRRAARASRPSGRPRAGWSARRPCRWPPSPPSPTASRSARASSTTGPGTSACSPRRSRRSTTWRPAGSSSGSARGGTRWPRRSASHRHHPLAGDARDGRGRRAGCSRWSASRSTASSCTSTTSRSTSSTATARPSTSRSTSAPPAMKMMELAGEIGDGVRPQLPGRARLQPRGDGGARRRARRAAGRSVDDIDRPQLVVCSLDDDRAVALDRARELVTQYLGQQPHIMKASGVDAVAARGDRQGPHVAGDPEQIQRAMHLVPDEVVQLITASGTPDECRAKVREYVDERLHVPDPVPAGRRRPGHDRRLRRTGSSGWRPSCRGRWTRRSS